VADPKGFMTTRRETPGRRPVDIRIQDWHEVYTEFGHSKLEKQAGRCMDCGIPFCHQGCPLGNLIPEWNDLVWRRDWHEAAERLHATNNFPEFTGRLCPAPCETACVLGINADPVTIKQVEVEIIDRAWAEGWVTPQPPAVLTGRQVAVVAVLDEAAPLEAKGLDAGGGPVGLRLGERHPVRRDAVVLRGPDREPAPAAADVEERLARFQPELAADEIDLVLLRLLELAVRIAIVGAGVEHERVQEQGVEVVRDIVVMRDGLSVAPL